MNIAQQVRIANRGKTQGNTFASMRVASHSTCLLHQMDAHLPALQAALCEIEHASTFSRLLADYFVQSSRATCALSVTLSCSARMPRTIDLSSLVQTCPDKECISAAVAQHSWTLQAAKVARLCIVALAVKVSIPVKLRLIFICKACTRAWDASGRDVRPQAWWSCSQQSQQDSSTGTDG